VRAAAIACLGALGKELHAASPDDRVDDRAGDRVVDRLIELLHDKSIRSRVSAVRALGKIGNRRALGPLQEAARRECLDQLKAAIDDAIETVEKKAAK
jgi:HEAT repeat protein